MNYIRKFSNKNQNANDFFNSVANSISNKNSQTNYEKLAFQYQREKDMSFKNLSHTNQISSINTKFNIINEGMQVLDLGCSPGHWSNQIIEKVKPIDNSLVVGVDQKDINEIPQLTFVRADALDEQLYLNVLKITDNRKFDCVVSDIIPQLEFEKRQIHIESIDQNVKIIESATKLLKLNGTLVIKMIKGQADNQLLDYCKKQFSKVQKQEPKDSHINDELQIICQSFGNTKQQENYIEFGRFQSEIIHWEEQSFIDDDFINENESLLFSEAKIQYQLHKEKMDNEEIAFLNDIGIQSTTDLEEDFNNVDKLDDKYSQQIDKVDPIKDELREFSSKQYDQEERLKNKPKKEIIKEFKDMSKNYEKDYSNLVKKQTGKRKTVDKFEQEINQIYQDNSLTTEEQDRLVLKLQNKRKVGQFTNEEHNYLDQIRKDTDEEFNIDFMTKQKNREKSSQRHIKNRFKRVTQNQTYDHLKRNNKDVFREIMDSQEDDHL